MSNTIAQRLAKQPYAVTNAAIAANGGKWDEDYACYVFPDGSTGSFTDLRNGAAERSMTGEPLLRFQSGPAIN